MGLYVQAQVVAASAPRIVAPAPQGATPLISGAGNSSAAGLATATIHLGSSGIISLQQPAGQMPASFVEPTSAVSGMAADKSGGSVGVLGASLQALSLTPGPAGGSSNHGANGVLGAVPRGYVEMQRQQAPAHQANYPNGLMSGGNGGPQQRGGGGFGPASGHLQHPAYEYPSGPAYVNPQGAPPPGGVAGLPGGPGAPPGAVKIGSKVFVGGLSWETSDQKLRQYFENYGEVLEAFVSYDKNTGRPRGFGFVVFAEPHIADKVVSLQHTIDRREVRVALIYNPDLVPATPCTVGTQAALSGSYESRDAKTSLLLLTCEKLCVCASGGGEESGAASGHDTSPGQQQRS